MSLADDLQMADMDPHRDGGKHAPGRRAPLGIEVGHLVARNHSKANPHPHWPASPRRGRWAE